MRDEDYKRLDAQIAPIIAAAMEGMETKHLPPHLVFRAARAGARLGSLICLQDLPRYSGDRERFAGSYGPMLQIFAVKDRIEPEQWDEYFAMGLATTVMTIKVVDRGLLKIGPVDLGPLFVPKEERDGC